MKNKVKKLLIKRCGNKQKYFVNGKDWGHMEFDMCKFLSEKEENNKIIGFCTKDGRQIKKV